MRYDSIPYSLLKETAKWQAESRENSCFHPTQALFVGVINGWSLHVHEGVQGHGVLFPFPAFLCPLFNLVLVVRPVFVHDFVVLHQRLDVLPVEVSGGIFTLEKKQMMMGSFVMGVRSRMYTAP